jgi:type IV secretion system protein VirB10
MNATTEPTPGGIEGGVTLVSGPKRIQLTTLQKVAVAGLAASVFLAFIWVDYSLSRKEEGKQTEQFVVQPNRPAFRSPPLNLPPGPAPGLSSTPALSQSPAVPSLVPGAPGMAGAPGAPTADNAIFSYSGGGTGGGGSGSSAAPVQIQPAQTQNPASRDTGAAPSVSITPAKAEGSKAKLLRHPDLVLTKGTIISCTLQTAINSELAGYTKCVLPEAVRGATGNVVLLDRGTTIVGEVQSSRSAGQERIFILWDRVETPSHVVVSLASPGADQLGRMGVPGRVNTHFNERFGNAILLSIIQGSLEAGAALAGNSGSGTGTYFNSFQSNSQQLTNQSNKDIPSTIEKGQGGNVSIFVAQDIDFSEVYSLRRIR